MASYNVVCTIPISRKFTKTVSQLLQDALSMTHTWFTIVPNDLVFYSVLFYEHINDTNKTGIRNPV
jgi:hypothetical protein